MARGWTQFNVAHRVFSGIKTDLDSSTLMGTGRFWRWAKPDRCSPIYAVFGQAFDLAPRPLSSCWITHSQDSTKAPPIRAASGNIRVPFLCEFRGGGWHNAKGKTSGNLIAARVIGWRLPDYTPRFPVAADRHVGQFWPDGGCIGRLDGTTDHEAAQHGERNRCRDLVRAIHREGATLVASGCLMNCLVRELCQPVQSGEQSRRTS